MDGRIYPPPAEWAAALAEGGAAAELTADAGDEDKDGERGRDASGGASCAFFYCSGPNGRVHPVLCVAAAAKLNRRMVGTRGHFFLRSLSPLPPSSDSSSSADQSEAMRLLFFPTAPLPTAGRDLERNQRNG